MSVSNGELLFNAANRGDLKQVKELLSKGTGTGYKDGYGWSALIVASHYGKLEVVRTLLEYKAEVNAKNEDGWSALMMASWNGHHECVRTLLEYGADINAKRNTGKDALYWACYKQKWDVAEFLLLKNADADVKDKDGDSALKHINKHNKQDMLTRVQRALKQSPPTLASNSTVPVPAAVTSPDVLKNQVQGSEVIIKSLTSKLSEVEKRNKLLSGDHDALSNISLEQCDELILTLSRSQEKLLQRKSFLVSERNLCVICQDAQKTILLRPCNHLCLCGNCATNVAAVRRCPLCNTTITERITVFA